MFDNLRELSDAPLYEDDQNQDDLFKDADDVQPSLAAPASKKKNGTFLGMTAPQRFLISVMLMFTVLLLGTLAMFVLGRMSIF